MLVYEYGQPIYREAGHHQPSYEAEHDDLHFSSSCEAGLGFQQQAETQQIPLSEAGYPTEPPDSDERSSHFFEGTES